MNYSLNTAHVYYYLGTFCDAYWFFYRIEEACSQKWNLFRNRASLVELFLALLLHN